MLVDATVPYIDSVESVLTPAECRKLIARFEDSQPETAPINTVFGPRVRTDIRNNERVMFDDPELTADWFDRIEAHAPPKCHGRVLVGANERVRMYRYKVGMRFAPHQDGAFVRNAREQSFFSVLLYLNEGFGGGDTVFITKPEVRITPKQGLVLFFQHPIVHEGAEITSGIKYVARTDLMYRAT